jgi:hypothetical protein
MPFERSSHPDELIGFISRQRANELGEDQLLAHLPQHRRSSIGMAALNEFDQRGKCLICLPSDASYHKGRVYDRTINLSADPVSNGLCNQVNPLGRDKVSLIRVTCIEECLNLIPQFLRDCVLF